MHVRRGDACETFDGYAAGPLDLDAPRSCYPLDEYVSAARQLRRLYGTSSVVHLISDSAAVTAMLSAYSDFEWRTLDFRRNVVGRGTPNLRVGARQRVYMEVRAQEADPANEEIVHKQDAEIRRLASMIRRMDDDALTQRKEYDSVINERDILGAQLIRRNDEIGLLQEKLKIQHSTLTRGEEQYSARVHDVQVLRLKIRDMQREVAVASGGAQLSDDLRRDLLQ